VKFVVGLLASLTISGAALAQATATLTPSPRALELSRQLSDVLGDEAQLTAMLRAAQRNTVQAMLAARGADPAQIDKFLAEINPPGRLEALVRKMRVMQVAMYAKIYSAEELEGILAFYVSPSGKAMLAKMPTVVSEVSMATTALMMEYRDAVARDIAAKLQQERSSGKPAA